MAEKNKEFQVFDWSAMWRETCAHRKTFYWLVPVSLVAVWVLTFNKANYFDSSVVLATEEIRAMDGNRVFTMGRSEDYDLNYTLSVNAINPEDYEFILSSTDFLCTILQTPVMTKDSLFVGSYYEYLVNCHRYTWLESLFRLVRGQRRPEPGVSLPAADPFYLRGYAAEAVSLARKALSSETNRRTAAVTLRVREQDPLVAALVARATTEELEAFMTRYHYSKRLALGKAMREKVAETHQAYESAIARGDQAEAALLRDAYQSFQRQAIILEAQAREEKTLYVLHNASVPTEKAGPHHLLMAIAGCFVISFVVLLWICRKELLGL